MFAHYHRRRSVRACVCVQSDDIRQLIAPPSVGTRGFVPGGGRGRTCCKPIEPPPATWGTYTVAASPSTRLVHIGDTVPSPRLFPSRRPAERLACPAPSVLLLHNTPTQTAELTSLYPPPPPQPPRPTNLTAQLDYVSTSSAPVKDKHFWHTHTRARATRI